jgi:hypothetical protein
MNFEELVQNGMQWDKEDDDVFNSMHCWSQAKGKLIVYWNTEYKNKNNIDKRYFIPHRVIAERIIQKTLNKNDWVTFKDGNVLNFTKENLNISLYTERAEQNLKGRQLEYDLIDEDLFNELNLRFDSAGYPITDVPKRLWEKYKIKQSTFHFHRLIGERIAGRKLLKKEKVDHINGNLCDMRRENLRVVIHKINIDNRVSINKNNTSGERGIYFRKDVKKRPWAAQYNELGKHISLGSYATKEEAVEAIRKYRSEHVEGSSEYRTANQV